MLRFNGDFQDKGSNTKKPIMFNMYLFRTCSYSQNAPDIISGDMCFAHMYDKEFIETITKNDINCVMFNRTELAPDISSYNLEEVENGRNELNIPFDSHEFKAMIALRILFVSEGAHDIWAKPVGSHQTTIAAKEVYKFLGCEKNFFGIFVPVVTAKRRRLGATYKHNQLYTKRRKNKRKVFQKAFQGFRCGVRLGDASK